MFGKLLNWYRLQRKNDKQKRSEFALKQATEKSEELYQICEFNGDIWLTYDKHLVCPIAMFSDSTFAVAILKQMREYYLKDVCGLNIEKRKGFTEFPTRRKQK